MSRVVGCSFRARSSGRARCIPTNGLGSGQPASRSNRYSLKGRLDGQPRGSARRVVRGGAPRTGNTNNCVPVRRWTPRQTELRIHSEQNQLTPRIHFLGSAKRKFDGAQVSIINFEIITHSTIDRPRERPTQDDLARLQGNTSVEVAFG